MLSFLARMRRRSPILHPKNPRAYAVWHTRGYAPERREAQINLRLSFAALIAKSERIDQSVRDRAAQIEHVLRTGGTLACYGWECPKVCGFSHGEYVEKGATPLHNAPTCRCGLLMRPQPGAAGRIMTAKEASALWRERNWGSAAATGPGQFPGSKYGALPADKATHTAAPAKTVS
jgi:hypothetical protein